MVPLSVAKTTREFRRKFTFNFAAVTYKSINGTNSTGYRLQRQTKLNFGETGLNRQRKKGKMRPAVPRGIRVPFYGTRARARAI